MVSGLGGLVATIILEPRLEVISNLNRLQQQKLRRQVKIQVNEKKKQMRNVISNQVNQMAGKNESSNNTHHGGPSMPSLNQNQSNKMQQISNQRAGALGVSNSSNIGSINQ